MKRLLTILLFITLIADLSAQDRIPESVKVISVYAGSIILEAVGDGLNDDGQKEWGHLCNALSAGVLLASPFIIDYEKNKWGWYLTSYVCLRISLFDPIYNASRGLPLTYIGSTSFWDKSLQQLAPPDGLLFGRGVTFVIGVSILINELGKTKRR